MKKLALLLALTLLSTLMILPMTAGAAPEEKVIIIDQSTNGENMILSDSALWADGDGGYYYLDNDNVAAFRFVFEDNTTAASVVVPAAGNFVISVATFYEPTDYLDAEARSQWVELANYTDYLPTGVLEFGMDEEHGFSSNWEPRYEAFDVTNYLSQTVDHTLWIIVSDHSRGDGNGPLLYTPAFMKKHAIMFGNERYNLENGLVKGDADYREGETAYEGAEYEGFEGFAKMTYTVDPDAGIVYETSPEESEPLETDPQPTEPVESDPQPTEPKETDPKETEGDDKPKETKPDSSDKEKDGGCGGSLSALALIPVMLTPALLRKKH